MKTPPQNNRPDPFFSLIQDGIAAINETSELIIKQGQNTVEFYLKSKCKEIDEYIISIENTGLGKFIAGEITLATDNTEYFHLEGDLYFKDKKENWTKKSVKGRSIKMEWVLTPDEQEKLRRNNRISFEYERPR